VLLGTLARTIGAPLGVLALALASAACAGIRTEAPFDQQFIDMMVPHHESAIAMAEIARERAERPELRALADEIVSAQGAEIVRLTEWRAEWYGAE